VKSPGFLVAERALAQHSDRLGARAVSPKELVGSLSEALPRLQTAISQELGDLTGNSKTNITIEKVERMGAPKVHRVIDQVGIHFLLGTRGAGEMLASLDRTSALMLTDQVFGGAGEAPAHLPDRLPAAASLTMVRLGEAMGRALGKGLDYPCALPIARQDEVLGKLLPAGEDEMLLLLRAEVLVGGNAPWHIIITIRESEAERLLGCSDGSNARSQHGDRRRPDGTPFGGMPLTLTAVLAELQLPVSRLANLQPGDTLPLPIRAEVPLRLGAVDIARAQPGCENGQIALRLTRVAWNEGNPKND